MRLHLSLASQLQQRIFIFILISTYHDVRSFYDYSRGSGEAKKFHFWPGLKDFDFHNILLLRSFFLASSLIVSTSQTHTSKAVAREKDFYLIDKKIGGALPTTKAKQFNGSKKRNFSDFLLLKSARRVSKRTSCSQIENISAFHFPSGCLSIEISCDSQERIATFVSRELLLSSVLWNSRGI